ncbi:MAG: InlB B-repeat-containing protein, partial [Firmicutes bacterium]|nr:InlB B-repeat-containing protein [Bacillota bacterium]
MKKISFRNMNKHRLLACVLGAFFAVNMFGVMLTVILTNRVAAISNFFPEHYYMRALSDDALFRRGGGINPEVAEKILDVIDYMRASGFSNPDGSITARHFSDVLVGPIDDRDFSNFNPSNPSTEPYWAGLFLPLFEGLPEYIDATVNNVQGSVEYFNDEFGIEIDSPLRVFTNDIATMTGARPWQLVHAKDDVLTLYMDDLYRLSPFNFDEDRIFDFDYMSSILRQNLLADFNDVLQFFPGAQNFIVPGGTPWQSNQSNSADVTYLCCPSERAGQYRDFSSWRSVWDYDLNRWVSRWVEEFRICCERPQFLMAQNPSPTGDLIWLPSMYETANSTDRPLLPNFENIDNPGDFSFVFIGWGWGLFNPQHRSGLWELHGWDRALTSIELSGYWGFDTLFGEFMMANWLRSHTDVNPDDFDTRFLGMDFFGGYNEYEILEPFQMAAIDMIFGLSTFNFGFFGSTDYGQIVNPSFVPFGVRPAIQICLTELRRAVDGYVPQERVNLEWDLNGGVITTVLPSQPLYNVAIEQPIPTRNYHQFAGWRVYAPSHTAHDQLWNFSIPITEPKRLIAQWTVNTTPSTSPQLTWSIAAHTVPRGSLTGSEPTYAIYGTTISKPMLNINSPNYVSLRAWQVQVGNNWVDWDFNNPITRSMDFRAAWDVGNITLSWDLNSGTWPAHASPLPMSRAWGTTGSGQFWTPTRPGYTFAGWLEDGTTNIFTTHHLHPGGGMRSKNLVAQWTPNDIATLTWDTNGGSLTVTPPSSANFNTVILAPVPTRLYHTFMGWQVHGTGTNWNFTNPITSTMHLVAQWVPATNSADAPQLTWNLGGG